MQIHLTKKNPNSDGNVMYWLKKDLLETMKMVYPECDIVQKILNRVEDCKELPGSILCYPLLSFDQHILNVFRQYFGPVWLRFDVLYWKFRQKTFQEHDLRP